MLSSMVGASVNKKLYHILTGKLGVFQFRYEPSIADIEFKDNEIIIIHSSFDINLANDWNPEDYMVDKLKREIELCGKVGAYAFVVHFGKSMALSQSRANNNMISLLIHVHNATIKYRQIFLLLETSAGQGTEMYYKLDDLANFYNKLQLIKVNGFFNRIRLCVDTCHIHVAGSDISTPALAQNYLDDFDAKIGLDHIKLIHLNGSAPEAGSRLDRHAPIGMGTISLESLQLFYDTFINRNVPLVLETQGDMLEQIKKFILN